MDIPPPPGSAPDARPPAPAAALPEPELDELATALIETGLLA